MLALLEGRDDAGVDWQAQEKLILEGLSKGSGSWSSWDDGAWARIGCILLCKGVSIMTVLRRICRMSGVTGLCSTESISVGEVAQEKLRSAVPVRVSPQGTGGGLSRGGGCLSPYLTKRSCANFHSSSGLATPGDAPATSCHACSCSFGVSGGVGEGARKSGQRCRKSAHIASNPIENADVLDAKSKLGLDEDGEPRKGVGTSGYGSS